MLADVAIGLLHCLVLPVGALLGLPVLFDDQFLMPILSLMLDLVTFVAPLLPMLRSGFFCCWWAR